MLANFENISNFSKRKLREKLVISELHIAYLNFFQMSESKLELYKIKDKDLELISIIVFKRVAKMRQKFQGMLTSSWLNATVRRHNEEISDADRNPPGYRQFHPYLRWSSEREH